MCGIKSKTVAFIKVMEPVPSLVPGVVAVICMPGRNHISRTQRLIALILLTIVYYVVPWHRAGAAASFVGLPLLLLHVLILPGSILLGTCRLRFRDSFGYITAAFLSGLAYFLLLAFLAALAGTSLGLFKTLLPIAVLAVAGLDWRPRGEPEPARTSSRRTWAIVFTAILAVVFVLVLRAGAPTGHTKDTLDHVGYIQEIPCARVGLNGRIATG